MFLRFQKERVKKARNVSLFNLEGSDNVLTHKGKLLLPPKMSSSLIFDAFSFINRATLLNSNRSGTRREQHGRGGLAFR